MKKLALTILIVFTCFLGYGQSPEEAAKSLGKQPIVFIDSIKVDLAEMQKFDPNQIASVTIYKDSANIGIYGHTTDGVIYIETKDFSRKRFLNYFKSKSIEFEQLLSSLGNDNSFQYILNGTVLKENYEGNLAAIDDKIFKSLTVLNKKELNTKYGILNKDFGISIISDVPDNLYNGEKKF